MASSLPIGNDFNSSFNTILNQTKHSLNRINEKYAPYPNVGMDPFNRFNGINNENILNVIQRNSDMDFKGSHSKNTGVKTFERRISSSAPSYHDEPAMSKIVERLTPIEDRQYEQVSFNSNSTKKIEGIEKSLDSANKSIERFSNDIKELQQTVSQLQHKNSLQSGIIEVLQTENDGKRSVLSKMEHWCRQNENWRTEIDEKFEIMEKQLKSLDRMRNEQLDRVSQMVTKYDLEVMRDRMNVTTQQTVAASLSSWHDKMEISIRQLEKQLSKLSTPSYSNAMDSNSTQNRSMVPNPVPIDSTFDLFPSDIAIKSRVESEVLLMQNKVEDELKENVSKLIQSGISTAFQMITKDTEEKLFKIISILDENNSMKSNEPIKVPSHIHEWTWGNPIKSVNQESTQDFYSQLSARLLQQKVESQQIAHQREIEQELGSLHNKQREIENSLLNFKDNVSIELKTTGGNVSNLMRKVEDSIQMSNNAVNQVHDSDGDQDAVDVKTMLWIEQVQTRTAKLEELVRDSELNTRKSTNTMREEMQTQWRETMKEFQHDMMSIDKRLIIAEKITEDCLDKVKHSTTIIESYLHNSPEFKRFQRNVEVVDTLQVDSKSIQLELRELSTNFYKLQAIAASKSEVLECRERLTTMEPTVYDKVPEMTMTVKKIMNENIPDLMQKISTTENLTNSLQRDLNNNINKISNLETNLIQCQGLLQANSDEYKLTTSRLNTNDGIYRNELNSMKDLIGSISSQMSNIDGKLGLHSKSNDSEVQNLKQQLNQLIVQLNYLEKDENQSQTKFFQLQTSFDSHKNDATTRLSTLSNRLDRLEYRPMVPLHTMYPYGGPMDSEMPSNPTPVPNDMQRMAPTPLKSTDTKKDLYRTQSYREGYPSTFTPNNKPETLPTTNPSSISRDAGYLQQFDLKVNSQDSPIQTIEKSLPITQSSVDNTSFQPLSVDVKKSPEKRLSFESTPTGKDYVEEGVHIAPRSNFTKTTSFLTSISTDFSPANSPKFVSGGNNSSDYYLPQTNHDIKLSDTLDDYNKSEDKLVLATSQSDRHSSSNQIPFATNKNSSLYSNTFESVDQSGKDDRLLSKLPTNLVEVKKNVVESVLSTSNPHLLKAEEKKLPVQTKPIPESTAISTNSTATKLVADKSVVNNNHHNDEDDDMSILSIPEMENMSPTVAKPSPFMPMPLSSALSSKTNLVNSATEPQTATNVHDKALPSTPVQDRKDTDKKPNPLDASTLSIPELEAFYPNSSPYHAQTNEFSTMDTISPIVGRSGYDPSKQLSDVKMGNTNKVSDVDMLSDWDDEDSDNPTENYQKHKNELSPVKRTPPPSEASTTVTSDRSNVQSNLRTDLPTAHSVQIDTIPMRTDFATAKGFQNTKDTDLKVPDKIDQSSIKGVVPFGVGSINRPDATPIKIIETKDSEKVDRLFTKGVESVDIGKAGQLSTKNVDSVEAGKAYALSVKPIEAKAISKVEPAVSVKDMGSSDIGKIDLPSSIQSIESKDIRKVDLTQSVKAVESKEIGKSEPALNVKGIEPKEFKKVDSTLYSKGLEPIKVDSTLPFKRTESKEIGKSEPSLTGKVVESKGFIQTDPAQSVKSKESKDIGKPASALPVKVMDSKDIGKLDSSSTGKTIGMKDNSRLDTAGISTNYDSSSNYDSSIHSISSVLSNPSQVEYTSNPMNTRKELKKPSNISETSKPAGGKVEDAVPALSNSKKIEDTIPLSVGSTDSADPVVNTNSSMTIRERLKLRQEALKQQKALKSSSSQDEPVTQSSLIVNNPKQELIVNNQTSGSESESDYSFSSSASSTTSYQIPSASDGDHEDSKSTMIKQPAVTVRSGNAGSFIGSRVFHPATKEKSKTNKSLSRVDESEEDNVDQIMTFEELEESY